jgi:hypothetical protein
MQLYFKNNIIEQNLINVYNVYNLFFNNYNNVINRDNLNNIIEQTLRMQSKSIIIKNFNLYYFL